MAEPLCTIAEWKELEAHYKEAQEWHMRDMFIDDFDRFDKFRCASPACGVYIMRFQVQYIFQLELVARTPAVLTVQLTHGIAIVDLQWRLL